ncbi:6834_t:CDS:10 [Dentiscutata erythropus]|uniref:6834_t:CDS:1 n=1 Tax=Dentiscutata erythropus TaxID=1348616 RepID=A0A9N9G1C0_9GLOM|nr:6834_t:CDS:10 [Dentiscutata erythropus]
MEDNSLTGHKPYKKDGKTILLPKTDQTRKLITRILTKLKKRKKPPSAFNSYVSEPDSSFNAEESCDLLNQLKDVLLVCELQGINFAHRSPYASRDPSPSRSNSPYPSNKKKSPGILEIILEILNDMVQNDCRYKVTNPRLIRPPNALQAIILDVAHLLINQNPHSSSWLYELGMALIPGFNCFSDPLRSRLLKFYSDFLIPQLISLQTGHINAAVSSLISKNNANSTVNYLTEKENSSHINITINDEHVPIEVDQSNLRKNSSNTNLDFSDNDHSVKHRRPARRLSISYSGDLLVDAYYTDSIFAPLLFSIFQFITIEESSLETLYQMHRTFGLMIYHKPGLYYDILEIIAYGDATSRSLALNILFYFWNNSIGHPSVGEVLPSIGYKGDLNTKENSSSKGIIPRKTSINQKKPSANVEDIHLHQLYPHIFLNDLNMYAGKDDRHTSLAEQSTYHPNTCVQCSKPVFEFGLRCWGCKLNIHFRCYNSPHGGFQAEYPLNSGVHKLATPRYCDIIHSKRECVFKGCFQGDNSDSPIISENIAEHKFHLVNLFTLALCIVCHLPLWGVMHQGYRCQLCNRFIHSGCLNSKHLETKARCKVSAMSESDVAIEYEDLRQDFCKYFDLTLIPENSISLHTYEELSMMLTILQIQDNIMQNGILAGCLVIKKQNHDPLASTSEDFERFELQETIDLYKSYLDDSKLSLCSLSVEYWNAIKKNYHPWMMLCEDYLAHIASVIKSSNHFEPSEQDYFDKHLSVYSAEANITPSQGTSNNSDRILASHELIKWIQENMKFRSSFSTKVILQQLVNVGFLERIDGHPILFDEDDPEKNIVECSIPLPFATECSSTVETLLTAISSCLSDVNISINECGFLFMLRRCWPGPFMSKYVLERLVYSIIEWMNDEDERLLIIGKEYTAARRLPGVRDEMEDNQQQKGYFPNSAGGGAYVISRKMLKEKYILQWLSAVHELNEELFCDIVYDQIKMVYENQNQQEHIDTNDDDFQFHDRMLKCIIRLWNEGLLFTSFNEILSKWLDEVYQLMKDQPQKFVEFRTLSKVFGLVKPTPQRKNHVDQITVASESNNINVSIDPIDTITKLFKNNDVQLSRALRWMELMVRAGVGLPGTVFSDYLSLLVNISPTLDQYTTFLQIIWYQVTIGLGNIIQRGTILKILFSINETTFDMIKKISKNGNETGIASAKSFVKTVLVLTLYSYNCPLESIYNLNIVDQLQHKPLSASILKRKSNIMDPTPGSKVTADTPLIQMLLNYARMEKLEVRSDVVKTFWRLFTSASLIFNKDEFIISSIPMLLPSVWEALAPIYDGSSDVTLQLLIRIVWTDPRLFLTSVSEVFEHPNWEVRFDGLDNLFGLFSKLDEKFEVSRAGVFAYLGPIFSYFVGCIWDQEEYVRTKAITYIRAMQPQHICLAIKCWDAYFKTASNREKTFLCRLMIKLNAKFPDWKVIEWDTLLSFLSQENIEAEEVSTTDILESYIRPDSILVVGLKRTKEDPGSTPGQRAAEEQNLRIVMLTLALQMLANGIEMTHDQITTLNYLIVSSLGFKNCILDTVDGVLSVHHGEFEYMPENFSQNMKMVSILGNLKRVLDTPIYLKSQNDDDMVVIEDELAGSYFIDTVLAMVNSSVDMSSLSHLMLKTWIELLLIIVYKHKIVQDKEDKEQLKEREENVVNAIKKTFELIPKDITEENKQLIIELSTSLLKRAHMLTVTILGTQIITIGKLLTKHRNDTNSTLVMSARTFLRTAFLTFARHGLFVLIFKDQAVASDDTEELDMFKVLQDVIRDEQITSEEASGPIYLRDEPIRDVFHQLFKFTNKLAVSSVLRSLNKYVELVHSKSFDDNLVNDLGAFLTKLSKHTSEWKATDWDVNPVLNIISIMLKHNPSSIKDIMPSIKGFLKYAINKCAVTIESFIKLMASYKAVVEIISPDDVKTNAFGEVILEELKTALRGARIRMSKDTLIILLQLILWDMQPSKHIMFQEIEQRFGDSKVTHSYFSNVSDNLFEDCVNFLESPPATRQYSEEDFKVRVYISQLVVSMCNQKDDLLAKISDRGHIFEDIAHQLLQKRGALK